MITPQTNPMVCIEHLEFVPCPQCEKPHPEWYSSDLVAWGIVNTYRTNKNEEEETK